MMEKNISYLREPQVFALTQLSKSTRWRLERDGKFPKRRQLSTRTVGWVEAEIEGWMKSRQLVDGGVHNEDNAK
jgi:prophage regulatory protein